MSMSPVPVSSSGRRGQPFCKATNWIPPVWAAGRSTSIIYSTHEVVRRNAAFIFQHRPFSIFLLVYIYPVPHV